MKKANKGITLVALVITVVLMIIIAGAAITIGINSDDIFGKANDTVEKWNNRISNEEERINNIFGRVKTNTDTNTIKQVNDANAGTLEESETTYTINSIEDLVAFAYNVNTNEELYSGKTVELGQSLDFQNDKSYANPQSKYILDDYGYKTNNSGTAIKQLLTDTAGVGFVPIGNEKSNGFAGTFDGKGYIIVHLYENSNIYGGLFGTTSNVITISNLGLEAGNVSSKQAPAGGILGNTNTTATIRNCYNTGTVTSTSAPAGGIAGWANLTATIHNCYNTGDIESTNSNAGGIAGGIAGTGSTVTDCYNTGKISGNNLTGGIVGTLAGGLINNCYSTGTVTSKNANAGGISGAIHNDLAVINSYNIGNVTGYISSGGILGNSTNQNYNVIVRNCYNRGNVISSKENAGGIVGRSANPVYAKNCYNSGNISAIENGAMSGGIVGNSTVNQSSLGSTRAYIDNCYNTGYVSSDSSAAGIIASVGSIISYCYNSGNIVANSPAWVGGIAAGSCAVRYSHNTGDIAGPDSSVVGEIIGYNNAEEGCTYLIKSNNANANGATGVSNMTNTMSMSNFITLMNNYVTENNSNTYNWSLKTWKLENGHPVFTN